MLKQIVQVAALGILCLTGSAMAIKTTQPDTPLPMPPIPPSMTQVI